MADLDFTLSLIDRITRPLKQAQTSVTGFAQHSQDAFGKIAVGVGGLWGVGMSIKGALGPAIDMYDTMQEASARGIGDDVLAKVSADALKFSMQYGKSAVEFVQSTADINAAVSGLSSEELPKVVRVANTVAAALKGTSGDAAEFMGQMFSQFSADANAMGKVQFAEQLAGKMSFMKQQFGTDMGVIKDLMEGSRGVGSNFGVGMDEQLAVLGELQRSLGTEASGSYEGFLSGAQEGAKKLGLSFLDAQGHMLSMPAMLEKLQGKYGKSIEGNLKAQAELDAAFGDSSAVVKQLYGNVDTLQRNITVLGGSDGLKRTQEMAQKMAKPWDRLMAVFEAIRIAIGLTLLPVLYPLLNGLADGGQKFARWMTLFPNIAKVVGYVALAILSLAGAGALANLVMGVAKFIMIGLKGIWAAFTLVMKLGTAAVWLYNGAIRAWAAGMAILRGVLLAIRIAAMTTGVAFNFLSWPILLIIGAIALLAVGLYLLIQHWDAVKAAIMQTDAFQALAAAVNWVADVFMTAWKWIADGWTWLVDSLGSLSPFDGMAAMAESIGNVFSGLWEWLKNSFAGTYNWIIDKLNLIPGINIEAKQVGDVPKPLQNEMSTGGATRGIDRGGLSKEINSNAKTTTDNSKRINTVNIYPQKGMTPTDLMEWQELGA
ncbi:phage tail tape measure protein [Ewingella americana]|uniref:Phage tail tape measure protein n=1 Tax=Ewingella americana TaxID=41202 RepID=A0A502GKI7_9GAMM|nr:phage tail tape measure protein [Ewingella americana]TPG61496.1 phage tail tape measure protein [Ewingella americana]